MRHSRLLLVAFHLLVLAPLWAQQGESYGDLMRPQLRSSGLSTPDSLRTYVVDGKLRLSLRDAVVLTIENNSAVRAQETQIESSKFAPRGPHSTFDPLITSTAIILSSIYPHFTYLLRAVGYTTQ